MTKIVAEAKLLTISGLKGNMMGKIRNIVEGSALGDLMAVGLITSGGTTITDGKDFIYSFAGDDIIAADGGNDFVDAGIGNDLVFGGTGNDRIYGDTGNDTLYGGDDNDRMYGGNDDDELYGEHGNDKLSAGAGNDMLDGGIGNDRLFGNKGNNQLFGGDGFDFISSGDHTSTLDGGADDDVLVLRMKKGGDHEATGGAGADEFQFRFASSSAVSDLTITDFELGIDSFNVDGVDDDLYMSLIGPGAVSEAGGNALLTLTTGDTVEFEGVSALAFNTEYSLF